jgi:hypothetical protein
MRSAPPATARAGGPSAYCDTRDIGLSCVVGGDAMTALDYLAIGVLIVLALWAVAAGKS